MSLYNPLPLPLRNGIERKGRRIRIGIERKERMERIERRGSLSLLLQSSSFKTTSIHLYIQTEREVDNEIDKEVDEDIDKEIEREIDREIDREVDKETDAEEEKNPLNQMVEISSSLGEILYFDEVHLPLSPLINNNIEKDMDNEVDKETVRGRSKNRYFLPRQDILKKLWKYIKYMKLQDKKDGRIILLNDDLYNLFVKSKNNKNKRNNKNNEKKNEKEENKEEGEQQQKQKEDERKAEREREEERRKRLNRVPNFYRPLHLPPAIDRQQQKEEGVSPHYAIDMFSLSSLLSLHILSNSPGGRSKWYYNKLPLTELREKAKKEGIEIYRGREIEREGERGRDRDGDGDGDGDRDRGRESLSSSPTKRKRRYKYKTKLELAALLAEKEREKSKI